MFVTNHVFSNAQERIKLNRRMSNRICLSLCFEATIKIHNWLIIYVLWIWRKEVKKWRNRRQQGCEMYTMKWAYNTLHSAHLAVFCFHNNFNEQRKKYHKFSNNCEKNSIGHKWYEHGNFRFTTEGKENRLLGIIRAHFLLFIILKTRD